MGKQGQTVYIVEWRSNDGRSYVDRILSGGDDRQRAIDAGAYLANVEGSAEWVGVVAYRAGAASPASACEVVAEWMGISARGADGDGALSTP